MNKTTGHLSHWAAYCMVGIGALVMLAPFYFMFVFATHSRTEIFSLPPPLFFGDDFLANLQILTSRLPFWRNLGWSFYVALASTALTLRSRLWSIDALASSVGRSVRSAKIPIDFCAYQSRKSRRRKKAPRPDSTV